MTGKFLYLILIIVVFVITAGCAEQAPQTIKEANICGDNICGATEDCNSCVVDCACIEGFCDENGICRSEICGDELCTPEEGSGKNCCEDCGCDNGEICNKITQNCQTTSDMSEDLIKDTVHQYLAETNTDGKIDEIKDAYFAEKAVKEVKVDCRQDESLYPCQIILYIDENGNIIESKRTS